MIEFPGVFILNAAKQIDNANESMNLRISDQYVSLKLDELHATHEYRERLKIEKDAGEDWGTAHFIIQIENQEPKTITVSGRDRWALEALIAAGDKGCTPIETPGPRWSGYTFNLRQLGVPVETVTEPHGGPFKGNHARYVLRATVSHLEGTQ